MRVFKTIGYIFAIIGLFIALLLLTYPVAYLFSFFSESPGVDFGADATYAVLCGLITFKANRKLCKLLDTTAAVKFCYIAIVVIDGVFFSQFYLGVAPAVVVFLAMLIPLTQRKKEIQQSEIKMQPRVCYICKQLNDPDANFCTNCGSGLMK